MIVPDIPFHVANALAVDEPGPITVPEPGDAQLNIPVPFVVNTCPLAPVSAGKVKTNDAKIEEGAANEISFDPDAIIKFVLVINGLVENINPVPLGAKVRLPLIFVVEIVLPLIVILLMAAEVKPVKAPPADSNATLFAKFMPPVPFQTANAVRVDEPGPITFPDATVDHDNVPTPLVVRT